MNAYELLTTETVADHIRSRPRLTHVVDADSITSVREVGDGNLNLVFVVSTPSRGIVLKQALPHVRVDPTWPMTPERARYEANALSVHGRIDQEHVPVLHDFDADRYILAMEDLSDHTVWRTALNAGQRHEGTAADLGTLIARTAFGSSALGLGTLEMKAEIARAVNPALCQITEDLVFTEPYIEHEHNSVHPGTEAVRRAFVGDAEVLRAAGRAKWDFMTRSEALIHGDLHTGSVMVRSATDSSPRSTKAFDSEFAFYGPVGFDIGAVWGNLVLAAARAAALGDQAHSAWCLAQPALLWDAFEAELRALWPRRVDPRVWDVDQLDHLLGQWRSDSARFAGAKVARRIIGFSKVSDIASLPEVEHVDAASRSLRAARSLLVEAPAAADVATAQVAIASIVQDGAL